MFSVILIFLCVALICMNQHVSASNPTTRIRNYHGKHHPNGACLGSYSLCPHAHPYYCCGPRKKNQHYVRSSYVAKKSRNQIVTLWKGGPKDGYCHKHLRTFVGAHHVPFGLQYFCYYVVRLSDPVPKTLIKYRGVKVLPQKKLSSSSNATEEVTGDRKCLGYVEESEYFVDADGGHMYNATAMTDTVLERFMEYYPDPGNRTAGMVEEFKEFEIPVTLDELNVDTREHLWEGVID